MPRADFRLASQQVGADVWVLTVSGDGGAAAGADLARQLATLRGKPAQTHVVIDLSAAAVVRGSLCEHLIEGARRARGRGISVTVVTEESAVRKQLGGAADEGALRVKPLLAIGIRDALIATLA